MRDPKIMEVSSWLGKAQEDLHSAEWLLESPHGLYAAVGFHCQQAAEKALKAYLSWIELARQVWDFVIDRLPSETFPR